MPGGFKDFGAEVLASADVDEYLMRQSIMRFASTSARDTALSGNLEEGMFAWNSDNNELYYYTGSAWKPLMTQWTSYTPTWTNLTAGNGTVVARKRYVAGDLRMRGYITFGSTTSVSGNIQQTIENSETSDVGVSGGSGRANDSGTQIYLIQPFVDPSDTEIQFQHTETGNGGTINATAPFTWTTGDTLTWDITIPVA